MQPRVHLIFAGLMLVMLLGAPDATILATALPTIVAELGGIERLGEPIATVLRGLARALVPDAPARRQVDLRTWSFWTPRTRGPGGPSGPCPIRWIDESLLRGFGGQYIMVFRDLDLVAVTTSATTVTEERRGYRRQLFNLPETHIRPEVPESR